MDQTIRHFTPSDTAYQLINDSPLGEPDHPAPAVPTSDELLDGVQYGRGTRTGQTNKWGAWLTETVKKKRTTTYERDEANNITRLTYPDGDCVEYSYDENGNRLTEDRIPINVYWIWARDPSQIQNWAYAYEERFNKIKSETDPLSNTITYIYDYEEGVGEAGNLIRVEYPAVEDESGQVITPTVSYTYNAWGLMDTETDRRGTVTKYIYTEGTSDEASAPRIGLPSPSIGRGAGGEGLFASGVTPVPGLLTQVIEDFGSDSHLNLTTTYKNFDAQGNPLTIINPRGAVTTVTYDELGRVLTSENGLGFVNKYEYDERGNLIRLIEGYTADGATGRNRITTYSYDVDDRLLSLRTEGDGIVWEITNTYDMYGHLSSQNDNQGRTTTYSYDEADQLAAITDALGQPTSFSYSPKGELAAITYPDGRVVSFDYDERSNLTGLTPPGKPAHNFEHTVRDLVSTYAPPDVGAGSNNTLYSYNALRQLSKVTRPDNLELLLAYDKANRLHSLTVPRGTYTYSYDPSTCQINSIVAPDSVNLTYNYDGELIDQISWAGPINGTVGFTYDSHYRVTQETVNGSNPIAYQYTNDHLLTQAGDLSLTYYHQSALLNSTSLGNVSDSLEYNPFGELTRYSASTNSGDLYPVGYSFDQLARIKKPF